MSGFIQKVITFLSLFPFYFQETNSLSNYQFLFQDLAITTLIGITSKTFLKLSLLPQCTSLCPSEGPPGETPVVDSGMRDLFPFVHTERERGNRTPTFESWVERKVLAKENMASSFAVFHKIWGFHNGH